MIPVTHDKNLKRPAQDLLPLPPERPEPLRAALLHMSAILTAMSLGRTELSTPNIVAAIQEYVAETPSIAKEGAEMLRLATWPSKGVPIRDVTALLGCNDINRSDNGDDRLVAAEDWLIRLITTDRVVALLTKDLPDSDVRNEATICDIVVKAAEFGLVPLLPWLAAQVGWNPAAEEAQLVIYRAAEHEQLQVLDWFAQQPGVVFTFECNSLVRCAAEMGHVKVLEWLARQAGVNFTSKYINAYDYPVCVAAQHGQLKVLQWFAARAEGIDFSIGGNSPVRLAAAYGHLDVLKWLADKPGVSFIMGNNAAVYVAAGWGRLEVLKWLATRPGGRNIDFAARNNRAVCTAAHHGHLAVLKWLADKPGIDFAVENNLPACLAAEYGHLEVLKWLATQPGVLLNDPDHLVLRCASRCKYRRSHVLGWLATQPDIAAWMHLIGPI